MGRHTMSLWLLSTTASNHDHFPAGDFLAVRSGSGESCEKSGERRSAGKFVNATLVEVSRTRSFVHVYDWLFK